MKSNLVMETRKVLSGKNGRLDDEELEFLAREITKVGFKLGFARAYAVGPSLLEKLANELDRKEKQLNQLREIIG